MSYRHTIDLLKEWAGESNVVIGGWSNEDKSGVLVRVICPLGSHSLSYTLVVLTDGNVEEVWLDKYPGDMVFKNNPAIVLLRDQNLLFMSKGGVLCIEKSGRFRKTDLD